MKKGAFFLAALLGAWAILACGTTPAPSPPSPPDVARGAYLVKSVAGCGECHTPRDVAGNLDMSRWLGGVANRFDLLPDDDRRGSISAPNLTPPMRGRGTDAAVKRAILDGVDNIGQPLYPLMPYYVFHNMTSADADAIVAYLRTVPPVNGATPPRQELPTPLLAPADPFPVSSIPHTTLPAGDANFSRAEHGRYLAGQVGFCMDCHSVWRVGASSPLEAGSVFGGRRAFSARDWGVKPGSPPLIFSYNITPHASGIKGWSVAAVVKTLRTNTDDMGMPLCRPMPGGALGTFGGLTPDDARDIAYYVTTLPPIDSGDISQCTSLLDGGP